MSISIVTLAEASLGRAEKEERELKQINETLNIDCVNGDIEELTKYLEKNVSGFDSNIYKVELINNSEYDGENNCTIIYGMQIDGFRTPYKLIVFVENENIRYYAIPVSESEYEKMAAIPMTFSEDSLEHQIDIAKKEVLREYSGDAMIESQEVRKVLDKDLTPMLYVRTICGDEHGGKFVLEYVYKLK